MRKKDGENDVARRRETESIPALPLNQDRRARGLAPREEANTAAAFLFTRGASENVSKPQPTEPDERGGLIPLRVLESESARGWGDGGENEGWPV